jgi:hypothetical protein
MRELNQKLLEKKYEGKPPPVKSTKKDVYHYNFFIHKPKYVYTTDEKRLEKPSHHYGT